MKIIQQGAEAIILHDEENNLVVKKRIKKTYRIPEIDNKIRKLRTRGEARLLKRAGRIIKVPELIKEDEKSGEIIIKYIKGKKLSEELDNLKNNIKICRQIGGIVAELHDENIIHGDLTTSNMILSDEDNKIYIIDFGLGFYSKKTEDKAVDIHLFKQALEAKHFKHYSKFLNAFFKGYKTSENYQVVVERLKKVESRGRYK